MRCALACRQAWQTSKRCCTNAEDDVCQISCSSGGSHSVTLQLLWPCMQVVFYFAGHGSTDQQNRVVLEVVDRKKQSAKGTRKPHANMKLRDAQRVNYEEHPELKGILLGQTLIKPLQRWRQGLTLLVLLDCCRGPRHSAQPVRVRALNPDRVCAYVELAC